MQTTILLIGLFLSLPAMGAKNNDQKSTEDGKDSAIYVITQSIEKEEFYQTIQFAGNLKPFREVQVFSYIDGTIAEKYVENGTRVRAGQKILAVKNIQPGYNYAHHDVRAPIAGIVSGFDKEIGTLISKSKSLASIIDQSRLRVSVPVRQEQLNVLTTDNFRTEILPLGFEQPLTAKVFNVSPNVDPVLGTTTVVFELSETNSKIRSGMIARVSLKYDLKEALGIEEKFLLTDHFENKKYIYKVSEDMKAEKTFIETGVVRDGIIEILSGLDQGQVVVTRSSEDLENGSLLTNKKNSNDSTPNSKQKL